MKILMVGALTLSLAAASAAMAQPYGNGSDHGQDRKGEAGDHATWGQEYGGDHSWKRGERIGYNDWRGAQAVDYRQHHLRHPPRGYEWREANGQYVLAAVATGVIASIILNNGR